MADVVVQIVNRIARLRGVYAHELMQPQRGDKHVAEARQLAMWVCIRVLGMSARSTAWRIGNRDHTTGLYALKAIERRQRKPEYLAMTESLREIFTADTLAKKVTDQAAAAMVVAYTQRRQALLRQSAKKSVERRLGLWTDAQLDEQNKAFAQAMRRAGDAQN